MIVNDGKSSDDNVVKSDFGMLENEIEENRLKKKYRKTSGLDRERNKKPMTIKKKMKILRKRKRNKDHSFE